MGPPEAAALHPDREPWALRGLRLGIALSVAAAFAALVRDAPVLMGPDGLAPARPILARLAERVDDPFWRLPTLFCWVPATDTALRAGAVLGVLASLLLVSRRIAPWVALPLAFLYLSFANAGTTFFSFQWDSLIVEALVLVPLLGRGRLGVWLVWAFLARLYCESALAKALWSDDWTSLRAMGDYWRTAPLPTPLAWWADRLPAQVQAGLTAGTLVVEGLVPFAIPVGPRTRRAVFAVWTLLQLAIAATANFGVFNWLTMSLQLALLVPTDRRITRTELAFAALLVPLGLAGFANRFLPGEPLADVAELSQRWRVANVYHLFASVDPIRDEVEIVGSDDGLAWTALPIAYKPGEPMAWIAPYQPRVAFQLWFYTLGGRDTPLGLRVASPPFVSRLIQRWCDSPAVLTPLLTHPVTAPRYVTLRFWRARFAADAVGWARQDLGRYPAVYACGSDGAPVFPQVDALVR
jgi:hypothetical protein